MKKNTDVIDRLIRFVLMDFLLSLSYLGLELSPIVSNIGLVLGIVLLFTVVTGYCPFYGLFGYSTLKEPSGEMVAK